MNLQNKRAWLLAAISAVLIGIYLAYPEHRQHLFGLIPYAFLIRLPAVAFLPRRPPPWTPPPVPGTRTMNSGEVSKATGVSQRMIRHYESIGLMPRPDRRDNGYRDYSPASVERLRFIANARDLGFALVTRSSFYWACGTTEPAPAARSRPLRSNMPRISRARRQRLRPCVAPCWNSPKVAAVTSDPIARSLQDWLNHVAARLGN
jgi:DNA-binding transcriptional MerR regulator